MVAAGLGGEILGYRQLGFGPHEHLIHWDEGEREGPTAAWGGPGLELAEAGWLAGWVVRGTAADACGRESYCC